MRRRAALDGILRTQSEAWGATRAQLDATHEALTGAPFPPEIPDGAAAVRLTMLMLKAQDYAAPDENPVESVIQKGIAMENIYKPGTLAAKLAAEIEERAAPREPSKQVKPRAKFTRVRFTAGGTSRVQAGSIRGKVFDAIKAAGKAGTTLEALDALIGSSSRGYVQKLAEKGHVEMINDEESDAA